MHNRALSLLGLNYLYTLFDINSPEKLEAVASGVRVLGIAGLNVTIPYKEKIIKHLDALSPEAAEVQAVNTIVNQDGYLIGHNTDIAGFAEPLKAHKSELKGCAVALFGNGGAARAVIEALKNYEVGALHLIVRNEEKGSALKEEIERRSHNLKVELHNSSDAAVAETLRAVKLIVNATPVGAGESSPNLIAETAEIFSAGQIVYDLVYQPRLTPLLLHAQRQGATVIGGIEMLLAQGAKAFELWTGQAMPIDQIRPLLESQLDAAGTAAQAMQSKAQPQIPLSLPETSHQSSSKVAGSGAKSASKKYRKVSLSQEPDEATDATGTTDATGATGNLGVVPEKSSKSTGAATS